jgi:hypothetical protein
MRYFCPIILLFFLAASLHGQEDKNSLIIPYSSLSLKKSELYIPSVFVRNKKSKEGIAKVYVDSSGIVKAGLINASGKFIVKPKYRDFGKAQSGYIPLKNENAKWDFFSVSLKQVYEANADDFKIISHSLIIISDNLLSGALYKENNTIKSIPKEYKDIVFDSLSNNLTLYRYNIWQIASPAGAILHKTVLCDSLKFLDRGKYILYRKGISAICDLKNENCLLSSSEKVGNTGVKVIKYHESKKNKFIIFREKSFCGVRDWNDKVIIKPLFDSIRGPFKDDTVFICYKGKQITIFDDKGIVLSEPQVRTEKIFGFKEGRAKFLKAGYYGFIDIRGNVRVAPQYKEARDFKEGLAAVFLNNKWCFIDKDENIIVQPLYEEVIDFINGVAAVKKDKQWFFLDQKGERTSVSQYDSVKIEGGKWIAFRSGKKGLVSAEGKELLAPRYDYIEDIENKLVIVVKAGKWGVIDYFENFIVHLKYDRIIYSKESDQFLVMEKRKEETFLLPVELSKKK